MIYNDVIFQASEFYIPRGFKYKAYQNYQQTHTHNYYDGKMSINISNDESNIIFIIKMDGVYIDDKAGDCARRFFLNLKSLHILRELNIPNMIENEINEVGTKDMIAHYKGMIRNSRLLGI